MIYTLFTSLFIIHTGADDSINESEIITKCISLSIIHTGGDDSKKWIWNHHQVFIIINHSHRSRWFYQSFRFIVRIICSNVIYTWSDDYFNEYEIVTRWISSSIIHTGADYSINEYEITRHISSSIIHTWADDSVNEYAMTTFITVYIDYRGAGFIDLVDKK